MGESRDFEGLATVIEVTDAQVRLAPVEAGLGGEPLDVPTAEFGDRPVVGQVLQAQIVSSDGEVIVESGLVGTATRRSLKRTQAGYEVRGQRHAVVPFPEQLRDQRSQDVAARFDYWVFERPIAGLTGHFQDLAGSLAKWHSDQQQRVQDEHRAKQEATARKWSQQRDETDLQSFINPYNFVPLPDAPPVRATPPGHALRRAELLHGRIDFALQARSPVLVRDSEQAADGGPAGAPRRDGAVVVPGSSFKGALRSAFEAVTGSCLRVADLELVPAYRDVLRANNRVGWNLIEVVEVDRAHRPTKVLVCTDPVWFSFPILASVLGGGGIRTGARLELLPGGTSSVGSGGAARTEARDSTKVAPAGSGQGQLYTILVTDVRARKASKGVCFVGGAVPRTALEVSVDPGAWARFQGALDGTADMKPGQGADARRDEVELRVDKASPSQGRAFRQLQGLMMTVKPGKRQPTPGLRAGHVLWARIGSDGAGGKALLELAFAQTWRHGAAGDGSSLARRLELTNPGFGPCTGLDLCPACRVFGSARTEGKSESRTDSSGTDSPNYRGHLRFGPIAVTGDTTWVDLAPMGQPRPGSGQMYLAHESVPNGEDARAKRGDVPLREWGSALDLPGAPRPIRGRKFYWRTGPVAGRPDRHLLHKSHTGEDNSGRMLKKAELINSGSLISGSITFENLSPTDLAALLVALDPGRIAAHATPGRVRKSQSEPTTYCFTLGGGKPLGLGALEVTELTVTCEGASQRYTGAAATQEGAAEVQEWVDQLAATYPAAARTWPALLELCCWNAVNPAMVGYPRDQPWPDGGGSQDLFKAGFGWWKRSAGMPWDGVGGRGADLQEQHTYLTLPAATAPDVSLPIDPVGVPEPKQQGGARRGH